MKERVYIVPLRDAWNGTYKTRAKRAVSVIIKFMRRHMKEEDVKIGEHLNKHIWERGIKNPPRKVKVRALEYNDEIWVELFDKKFPFEEKQEKVKESKEKEEGQAKAQKSEKEVKKVESKVEEKMAKAESEKKEADKGKVKKEVKKESEKGTKRSVKKENKGTGVKKAEAKKSSITKEKAKK